MGIQRLSDSRGVNEQKRLSPPTRPRALLAQIRFCNIHSKSLGGAAWFDTHPETMGPGTFSPGSVTELIVKTVADETDTKIDDLPPLYEAVDTQALTKLFDRCGPDGIVSVVLQYHGETVKTREEKDSPSVELI